MEDPHPQRISTSAKHINILGEDWHLQKKTGSWEKIDIIKEDRHLQRISTSVKIDIIREDRHELSTHQYTSVHISTHQVHIVCSRTTTAMSPFPFIDWAIVIGIFTTSRFTTAPLCLRHTFWNWYHEALYSHMRCTHSHGVCLAISHMCTSDVASPYTLVYDLQMMYGSLYTHYACAHPLSACISPPHMCVCEHHTCVSVSTRRGWTSWVLCQECTPYGAHRSPNMPTRTCVWCVDGH